MSSGSLVRILVVEDDSSLADSIVDGLMDEGFAVGHAGDGEEALRALRGGDWDLVLLDWSLPGMDGLEVLRAYRAKGGSTPALFLTARSAVSERVLGLEEGADDYLCKPFAFEELLARARALLRRGRSVEVTSIEYREIRLDLASQRAERAGHPLDLTSKEFALLTLFVQHPGTILSRTRIYGQVWGDEHDPSSNTLEVHMNGLRRKLEARGPRLIHTLRGRGYLLGDLPTALSREAR
jgi:two-component system copper resistance phosphate regulon response regulator CusR